MQFNDATAAQINELNPAKTVLYANEETAAKVRAMRQKYPAIFAAGQIALSIGLIKVAITGPKEDRPQTPEEEEQSNLLTAIPIYTVLALLEEANDTVIPEECLKGTDQ